MPIRLSLTTMGGIGALLWLLSATAPLAQRGPAPAGVIGGFPRRPAADPQMLERGKALYSVNCQFCHGADTRGGDGGPSLLRSALAQDDRNGELIGPVVQNGRPPGMPKFQLSAEQVADIAAFLHSFTIDSRDPARMRPPSIVTGDPAAGEKYFSERCASCHSVAGNLKGIATRHPDPRALQQRWLLPGGDGRGRGAATATSPVTPVTATVTLVSGERFEGPLVRLDEFVVVLLDNTATTRSFRRDDTGLQVVVHDPLQAHRDLLHVYTDREIHDVTAYLVTLK
jgi:cytochrome c oxidase cbb3-type subunit 3